MSVEAIAQAARMLIVPGAGCFHAALKELAHRTGATRIVGIPGSGTQAFRLENTAREDGVADFCADQRIDFAFVPAGQRLDRVRVVAMDMDSTLITIECIDEIADMQGLRPEVAAITAAAMRGEIDFAASLARRVALLAGLDVSVLSSASMRSGCVSPRAPSACSRPSARSARDRCWSRADSLFFTERLKHRLGLTTPSQIRWRSSMAGSRAASKDRSSTQASRPTRCASSPHNSRTAMA